MDVPTVAEVDAIVAIGDPVVRNLRITQCYHELSSAVATRVGPGANWCTFATWASRQAGQTIRGEDFARAADDVLGSPEVVALVASVARLAQRELRGTTIDPIAASVRRILDPEAALRRAAAAVAEGNRKVFAEIGREFARWLASAGADRPPTPAAMAAFSAVLRDGDPPDGQRLLRDAFAAYAAASVAPEVKARAERLFLANLRVGLHEQTRLQPEIRASLDASIDGDAVRAQLLTLLFPRRWLGTRTHVARLVGRPLPADVAVDALIAAVRRRLRVVLTDVLMSLRLPGAVVRLGSDVSGAFPAELRDVADAELRELLSRVDRRPGATTGSGATDWAILAERMEFITDLFRCWHARPELFDPPYDAGQVAAMRDGRRPGGEL